MVVVKADAYGHGMVAVARAARDAGADWLGVATGAEALALREAGDTGPLLCWLAAPGDDFGPLVGAGVDVTAYSVAQLDEIVRGARRRDGRRASSSRSTPGSRAAGRPARTGWRWSRRPGGRGGRRRPGDRSLVPPRLRRRAGPPCQRRPAGGVRGGLALAEDAGLAPEVRHLANSAGALLLPHARHDLVRLGIAAYGFCPAPEVVTSAQLGLVPAMTVRGSVVLTKELAAGDGVSYGHTFVAEEPMRVALVPIGYGDGIPRHASSTAEVLVPGVRGRVLGRVCMDQFVVEAPGAHAGDEVVLFGPGSHGEPTATDWARWCGTIDYEIVTRMGGRQTRVWVDGSREHEHPALPRLRRGRTRRRCAAAVATGVVVERRVVGRARPGPPRPTGWARCARADRGEGRRRGGAARRGRRGGAVRRRAPASGVVPTT